MPRNRYSAAFYLVVVFASGILVGAVSHRLYETSTVSANVPVPRTADEVRKKYLSEMRAKVGVDDAQLTSVSQILDETKHRFDDLKRQEKPLRDAIQQKQVDSISALLTPAQKTAYDHWRAERAQAALADAQKKKDQQQKQK